MNHLYKTPFGEFKLKRIPDNDINLQAWNSADTYLLNHLAEQLKTRSLDLEKARILILNDAFGALTVSMAPFGCDSYSDSFIAHEAIVQNVNENCPEYLENVNLLKSTDVFVHNYDVILFKTVKTQAFFTDEILKLAPHIKDDALILGASMAKNLQKPTLELLNQVVGKTEASLTWKKARLIHVQVDPSQISNSQSNSQQKPFIQSDVTYQLDVDLLDKGNEVIHNLANVFSRNKLDIGSRFFLQHFPSLKRSYKNIIDLGCGNGVLALKAAQRFPDAQISCIDESYMAVASARLTLEENLTGENYHNFIAANGLTGIKGSADLILCNPPFHQGHVVGDAIAWQMFRQSKKVLERGGELWVVGNRHLAYHLKLKNLFGNQKLIASNNKFVILKAVKI